MLEITKSLGLSQLENANHRRLQCIRLPVADVFGPGYVKLSESALRDAHVHRIQCIKNGFADGHASAKTAAFVRDNCGLVGINPPRAASVCHMAGAPPIESPPVRGTCVR